MNLSLIISVKARMTRTLISAVMSSLLYQLSYSLMDTIHYTYEFINVCITYFHKHSADKGFEPLYAGHEPIMLPLHQSAFYSSY